MRRQRRRYKIRRSQLDYLLLEVFGPRYLPYDVACRIALRAELARGLLGAVERMDRMDRTSDPRPPQPTSLEALAETG